MSVKERQTLVQLEHTARTMRDLTHVFPAMLHVNRPVGVPERD